VNEIGRPKIHVARSAGAQPELDAEGREQSIHLVAPDGPREPALDQRDPRLRHSGSTTELPLAPGARAPLGPNDQADPLDELAMADRKVHADEIAGRTYRLVIRR
jgi:hypothetical protein